MEGLPGSQSLAAPSPSPLWVLGCGADAGRSGEAPAGRGWRAWTSWSAHSAGRLHPTEARPPLCNEPCAGEWLPLGFIVLPL